MEEQSKNYLLNFYNSPGIISCASAVGKYEKEGPAGDYFNLYSEDDKFNQDTWESAESEMVKLAFASALVNGNISNDDVDIILAGDLLNQCTASSYGLKDFRIPYFGLYGACSTMALSLIISAALVDGGYMDIAAAGTSSHFCSAEKQFRYPLEYGGQRTPSAQRTVTGAGMFIVGKENPEVIIKRAMPGKITDYGVKDMSNMGAAMAPAAAESLYSFFMATDTGPEDFSLILTGDLGKVGSNILIDLMKNNYHMDISDNYNDCGLIIYDCDKQDVHSGGSGCGCSAVILASYVMKRFKDKSLKNVLFAGTGALMSPLISFQGNSIASIAHVVELCSAGGNL